MVVMNAVVAVAIAVAVVVGNALSAVKVPEKQMQRYSLATPLVVHGPHPAWLAHRQPSPPAN
jgi:hypothetical protein